MWQPEAELTGPVRPGEADLPSLNQVFSEAFTDRYRRDGLPGVRVPHLDPAIWRFAIADAGDGAMVWRDQQGRVAAFNLAHRSGTEGWMGPLAVRPELQGRGLGTAMVRAAIDWLRRAGAGTIGLETMPRTVENIGFYGRLGFEPGALTITLAQDVPRRAARSAERLGALARPGPVAAECQALLAALAPGLDFSREIRLTREHGLGDVSLVRRGRRLVGWALWHSAPLAEGRLGDETRVLKVVAEDDAAFEAVSAALLAHAVEAGRRRVGLRVQTAVPGLFNRALDLGWRVHWTDLRMTLAGHPERPPAAGVVLSNWEV
ncbi:MAG TPA: GNAT family N-acetyltransferase [Gemmatimonadales bacterium]|nr:GNAT family N-acetyltransferase [Gemmatimonadales bacterium]